MIDAECYLLAAALDRNAHSGLISINKIKAIRFLHEDIEACAPIIEGVSVFITCHYVPGYNSSPLPLFVSTCYSFAITNSRKIVVKYSRVQCGG